MKAAATSALGLPTSAFTALGSKAHAHTEAAKLQTAQGSKKLDTLYTFSQNGLPKEELPIQVCDLKLAGGFRLVLLNNSRLGERHQSYPCL